MPITTTPIVDSFDAGLVVAAGTGVPARPRYEGRLCAEQGALGGEQVTEVGGSAGWGVARPDSRRHQLIHKLGHSALMGGRSRGFTGLPRLSYRRGGVSRWADGVGVKLLEQLTAGTSSGR